MGAFADSLGPQVGLFFNQKFILVFVALVMFSSFAQGQSASDKTRLKQIEDDIAELKTALASSETSTASVTAMRAELSDLDSRIAVLSRSQESAMAQNEAMTKLEGDVRKLETELGYLRTQVADTTMPVVRAQSANAMSVGDATLELHGLAQQRFTLDVAKAFDGTNVAAFSIPRARLDARIGLADSRLSGRIHGDFGLNGALLLDALLEYQVTRWLGIRAGQGKTPYSRSFMSDGYALDFHQRATSVEALRYDRDVGLWAYGRFSNAANKKIRWIAGVANGSGPNVANDNIDVALSLRLDAPIIGSFIEHNSVNLQRSDKLRLSVGVGAVHDLVALPDRIAGLQFGNSDVDRDNFKDNVRVVSLSLDGVLRYKGFEAELELLYRHERWGAILQHLDNGQITALVRPDSQGVRNYLGGVAKLSYFVLPKLMVAGRVSHIRVPLLRMSGIELPTQPGGDRLLETGALVQWYSDHSRMIGLSYSLFNYNDLIALTDDNDMSHQFIVESQFRF